MLPNVFCPAQHLLGCPVRALVRSLSLHAFTARKHITCTAVAVICCLVPKPGRAPACAASTSDGCCECAAGQQHHVRLLLRVLCQHVVNKCCGIAECQVYALCAAITHTAVSSLRCKRVRWAGADLAPLQQLSGHDQCGLQLQPGLCWQDDQGGARGVWPARCACEGLGFVNGLLSAQARCPAGNAVENPVFVVQKPRTAAWSTRSMA